MNNTEILNKLTEGQTSNWHERAEWREQNTIWLKKSAQIAITVLSQLRAKNMSQKQLAVELGVSPQYVNKIVKGSENLTLETICKLESVLGITIIEIKSEKNEPIESKEKAFRTTHRNYSKKVQSEAI